MGERLALPVEVRGGGDVVLDRAGAGAQGGMLAAQAAQMSEELVERVRRIKLVVRPGARGGEQRRVAIRRRARREHVLARLLIVAAAADHALLVAVVQHGLAAHKVHQAVAESREVGDPLRGGAGIVLQQEIAPAPDVVVAEERHAGVDVAVVVRVTIVLREEIAERRAGASLGNELAGGPGEGEVRRGIGRHRAGGEFAEVPDVSRLVHHLAELEEVRPPAPAGLFAQGGIEGLAARAERDQIH